MNTTLSTASRAHEPRQPDQPPHPERPAQRERRRVGLVDRAALHLGVALVAWSRRPRANDTRERRARRIEQYVARLERERAAERELRLTVPRR